QQQCDQQADSGERQSFEDVSEFSEAFQIRCVPSLREKTDAFTRVTSIPVCPKRANWLPVAYWYQTGLSGA
ncbi:MAG: hypothetical protein JXB30_04015, partial [Anaerolineae bacterium]|nr:hypothetical protein [Anaerolineae bacterium]